MVKLAGSRRHYENEQQSECRVDQDGIERVPCQGLGGWSAHLRSSMGPPLAIDDPDPYDHII